MTAVTRMNSFEGGTPGATITTANSGGASGDAFDVVSATAPVFSSTAAVGSVAAAFQAASGSQCLVRYAPVALNDVQGVGRFYINVPSSPTQVSQYLAFYNGGTLIAAIGLNASRIPIVLNAAATTIFTATTALTVNTYYRLEVDLTVGGSTSTGILNFDYYLGGSTTPIAGGSFSTTTANLGTTNITRVQLGKVSTTTDTSTTLIDAVAVASGSTTRFGPAYVVPSAAFTTSTIGTDVVCADSSTYVAPATSISSWAWSFGDGGTSTVQNPTHTYTTAGTYTVGLTVTDNNSQTSTQTTHPVTVTAPGTAASPAIVLGTTSGFTTQAGSTTAANILSATTDTSAGAPVTTTWAWSATGGELDFGQITIAPPASGQPLVCTLYIDRLNSSSGTLAAQLVEGSTTRSSLTGIAIPDMTASGGSGTTTSGTVAGTVELIFPWTDVQSVVDWNQLILKLQVTTA